MLVNEVLEKYPQKYLVAASGMAGTDSANYDLRRIAVERNCEIVPKAKYAEVVLEAGDVVEVVNFVGGG